MNSKSYIIAGLACFIIAMNNPVSAQETPESSFITAKSDFRDNLSIFFRNETQEAVKVRDVFIDDRNIKDMASNSGKIAWNETKDKIVRWYDIVPSVVPPQSFGLVKIRFGTKGETGDNIKVKLISEKGKEILDSTLKVEKNAPVDFNYYSLDSGFKKLDLYLSTPDKIKGVILKGKNCKFTSKNINTENAKKYLLNIEVPEALKEGEYAVAVVLTDKGPAGTLIKAISPFFSIGMFRVNMSKAGKAEAGPPPEEWVRDCKEHLINTMIYAWEKDNFPEIVSKYDMRMSFQPHFEASAKKGQEFGTTPSSWGWSMGDEPEAWNCPPMRLLKAINALRKNAPATSYSLVFCTRLAPFEYNFSDIPFADYYPVPTSPLEGCGRMVETLKYATSPNPVGFIPQAFKGGQSPTSKNSNIARWNRFPTPAEERLMVYDAIANGAKAIHYFAYNTEPNEPVFGVGQSEDEHAKELWSEIQKINAEIEILAPYLWAGDTCAIGSCDNKNVEVRTIFADKAIICFLINRDYNYTKEKFEVKAQKNCKIKLDVPSWFKPYNVYEFDWQGLKKTDYKTTSGDSIEVTVGELDALKILVIPDTESTYLDIVGRTFDTIIPVKKATEKHKMDGELSEFKEIEPIVLDANYANPLYSYSGNYKESEDLNIKMYLSWDDLNFYIAAKVKDNIFRQTKEADSIWAEDMLQVAFDPRDNSYGETGYKEDDAEYGFALTKKGPVCYCWSNLDKNKTGLRTDIDVSIKKSGDCILYEAVIPLKELNLNPDKLFGFNFLAVDTDTGSYWNGPKFISLSPGIIGGKNPSAFKKFILAGGKK